MMVCCNLQPSTHSLSWLRLALLGLQIQFPWQAAPSYQISIPVRMPFPHLLNSSAADATLDLDLLTFPLSMLSRASSHSRGLLVSAHSPASPHAQMPRRIMRQNQWPRSEPGPLFIAHFKSFMLLARLTPVLMSDAYAACCIPVPPKLRRQTPSRSSTPAHSRPWLVQPNRSSIRREHERQSSTDKLSSGIKGLLLCHEDTKQITLSCRVSNLPQIGSSQRLSL